MDYLHVKGKYSEYKEEWLRELSGSTEENFHASGRKERTERRLRLKVRQNVEGLLSLLRGLALEWEDRAEVWSAYVYNPKLSKQLGLTSYLQPKPDSRAYELYAKVYPFPKDVLGRAETLMLEIGHCALGSSLLEEVSEKIDSSEEREYIFRRRYFKKKVVDACREVWKKRSEFEGPAEMAAYVCNTHEVEG